MDDARLATRETSLSPIERPSIEPVDPKDGWTPFGPILILGQSDVNDFCQRTGDCNPIHTNPAVATAFGLGGTVLPGLMILSFLPTLAPWIQKRLPKTLGEPEVAIMGITNKFRNFIRVGTPICVRSKLNSKKAMGTGYLCDYEYEVCIEGQETPCMKGNVMIWYS